MSTTIHDAVERVPIDRIVPNDWNPNAMEPAQRQKLRDSIQSFGAIDPATGVRLADGTVRILDGEHRWEVARDLGYTEYPVNILGDETQVSPARQRQLTLLLNELRGTHDPARTALVIQEVFQFAQDEPVVLPYSDLQIHDLLSQFGTDDVAAPYQLETDTFDQQLHRSRRAVPDRTAWKTLLFNLPESAALVVRQALDAARDDGAGDDDWQALEAICADYLAGMSGGHDVAEDHA